MFVWSITMNVHGRRKLLGRLEAVRLKILHGFNRHKVEKQNLPKRIPGSYYQHAKLYV